MIAHINNLVEKTRVVLEKGDSLPVSSPTHSQRVAICQKVRCIKNRLRRRLWEEAI
jgi:hypothetical protein